jgi:hypothetical protein
VRIAAGAFGDNVPHCELLLSPDHAIFVSGALITVCYLVNGSSIPQVERADFRFFHIEMEAHLATGGGTTGRELPRYRQSCSVRTCAVGRPCQERAGRIMASSR